MSSWGKVADWNINSDIESWYADKSDGASPYKNISYTKEPHFCCCIENGFPLMKEYKIIFNDFLFFIFLMTINGYFLKVFI